MRDPSGAARVGFFRKLSVRVSLLYALPVTLILAGAAWLDYHLDAATELGALQARLSGLVVGLSRSVPPAVAMPAWTEADRVALAASFAAVGDNEPEVSSIYVLYPSDEQGYYRFASDWVRKGRGAAVLGQRYDIAQAPRLAETMRTARPQVESAVYTDEWGTVLSGYAPIVDPGGRAVAVLGADITASRVDEAAHRALLQSGILFGLVSLSIVAVGLLVARRLDAPLRRLTAAADAIAAGKLDTRTGLARRDELGVLATGFDRMAQGLEERERIRSVFGQYLSEGVATKLLANPEALALGGEERVVTVLFSDIEHYSTISEKLPAPEVVAILNEYLAAMCDAIDEDHGVVIEILGDGIFAVFGAPEAVADHAARAVSCARIMARRLRELNARWAEAARQRPDGASGVALRARIGIHTGTAVAGNIGGARRRKYAVIGDTVNVAARVEQLNKTVGGTLLVTADTLAALPAEVAAEAVDRGEHVLKGREQRVRVYGFAWAAGA
ncbi:MAG: HAMP domain-containing protein [Myxococcales bacterium]|nr:HAMP domain-containing protein [Myxococcales bacterium]